MTAECIFCRIAKKEMPSSVIYEDADVMAFHDIAPQAPVHAVFISKEHISGVADIRDVSVAGKMIAAINSVVKSGKLGGSLKQEGFRIVVNSGKNGGQAVPHLHFHLLGGRQMDWPPG